MAEEAARMQIRGDNVSTKYNKTGDAARIVLQSLGSPVVKKIPKDSKYPLPKQLETIDQYYTETPYLYPGYDGLNINAAHHLWNNPSDKYGQEHQTFWMNNIRHLNRISQDPVGAEMYEYYKGWDFAPEDQVRAPFVEAVHPGFWTGGKENLESFKEDVAGHELTHTYHILNGIQQDAYDQGLEEEHLVRMHDVKHSRSPNTAAYAQSYIDDDLVHMLGSDDVDPDYEDKLKDFYNKVIKRIKRRN